MKVMDMTASPADTSPTANRVRLAAVGDLHVGAPGDRDMALDLSELHTKADVLIVAGDLTENGRLPEAEAAADQLSACRLPIVAVLGNHDLRSLRRSAFRKVFERAGVIVLAGEATVVVLSNNLRLGIAGTTGCGGGFWPLEGPDAVHARTMKRLAVRGRREAFLLEEALLSVQADIRIAATHYAPTASTLGSEPIAKYWMLGNAELGAAIDRRQPDLVIHGHAHLGALRGRTPGGVPVRNVALPVVGRVHIEELPAVWSRPRPIAVGLADSGVLRCGL